MDPIEIISRFYDNNSKAFDILVKHGKDVTRKALETAHKVSHLNPNIYFIKEAAMLHDIGIYMTHAPDLGCTGPHPYICHGYLGRSLMDDIGLPVHGLVCERHVGVGITIQDIKKQNLPLPVRDMLPVSLEEKIICFADKFYFKSKGGSKGQLTVKHIKKAVNAFGNDNANRFQALLDLFNEPLST
jgi:uncharacterized protein